MNWKIYQRKLLGPDGGTLPGTVENHKNLRVAGALVKN
jgi:hypothetical protein